MNTTSASRRIWRGDRNDVAIITTKAGARNITWRLTKWNGSSPMRVATGGLAASDSTMPASISTAIAASISRSTVHHQLAKRVRSAREIIDELSVGRAKRSVPATYGHGASAPLSALHSSAMVYE